MKLIMCLVLILLSAFAYDAFCAVTTTVDFLKLSVGARQTAMGESAVAACDDVTALYWNPAGLAAIHKPALEFSHSSALMDASLEFLGAAYSFGGYGTLSLGGIFYLIKPVPVTDATGQVMGDLNWRDQAIILSYGYKVTDRISAGAGIKLVQRMESDPIFGSSQGSTYGLDAGVMYKTPLKGVSLGCALLNTGPALLMSGETKKDVLPQTTRAGLSYERESGKNMTLTVTGDMFRILGGDWNFGGGCEMCAYKMLFIRAGYYTKEGNISGNTYGAGFRFRNFQVDFSNVPASEMIGYTRSNMVSLSVLFD